MWVLYSVLAAVGFGCISLILTYLSKSNINSLIVNTWFWLSTALIFLVTSLAVSSKQLKIQGEYIKWFVLLAFIAAATNYFSIKAFQVGPNTGLVRSVQFLQIAVALLGAYFLFNQPISVLSAIGVIFIIVGILLITLK